MTLWIHIYYPRTVLLVKYDHVALSLDAALVSHDHHANVFVYIEVLYLRNVVWKAVSVTKMSRSVINDGDAAVKETWTDGKKISSQGIAVMYSVQKKIQLVGAGYAILDWLTEPIRFPNKLSECARVSSNYKRALLHAIMEWPLLTFPGEEALTMCASCTRWDPIFDSAIPYQDVGEREKRFARYTWTETLLIEHREKPENMRYARYQV